MDDFESEESQSMNSFDGIKQKEKEDYELMRICRLNRIKIKNPQKWDGA